MSMHKTHANTLIFLGKMHNLEAGLRSYDCPRASYEEARKKKKAAQSHLSVIRAVDFTNRVFCKYLLSICENYFSLISSGKSTRACI